MRVHSTLSGGRPSRESLQGLPREAAFPPDEYRARIESVRLGMRERGIDVLLVHQPSSALYLTGYQTFSTIAGECVIVPLEGEPTLLIPPPEIGGAVMHSWLDDIRGYPPTTSQERYAAETLNDAGLASSRVGVDMRSHGLSAGSYASLMEALPRAAFVDGAGILEAVKAIKSPREIAHIRRAAQTTASGMAAATEAIREGASDNDVAAAASHAMIAAGSEYMCVAPIVTAGRRSGILHSTHKRHRLERGDVVLIELGGCFHRYTAPTMRTVFVGDPPREARRMAESCLAALQATLAAIRPGRAAGEAARAGMAALSQAGGDFVFHGSFGYSVGAGFPPSWADGGGVIMLGVETILRPGMVFHHPVALRRLGLYGTAFSETTVVTETGCEVLTSSPREIVTR